MLKQNITVLLSLLFIFYSDINYAETRSNSVEKTKRRISWEEVLGATKYRVQIKDKYEKYIINKDVDTNYIDFLISPGNYKIRVGAMNKFSKVGAWSDWIDMNNIKTKMPKKRTSPPISLPYLGLKIGVGLPYFQILDTWENIYDNSYSGFVVNIGYGLDHIRYLKPFWFAKYSGVELEANNIILKGKEQPNRIKSDLNNLITGGSLYFKTDMDFPINFYIRAGTGIVYTIQKYNEYDTLGNKTGTEKLESVDPYYRIGLSIEYRFLSLFFLEISGDYHIIDYYDNNLNSLRYTCFIGMFI